MKVFTAQQMRDFDKQAVEEYNIPSIVLMENAALRVVEFLEAKFSPLSDRKIVIICGKGNNGGDGLAIARHLQDSLMSVLVLGEIEALQGDARSNLLMAMAAGQYIEQISTPDAAQLFRLHQTLSQADIVLDAILGTGFSGEVKEPLMEILHLIAKASKPIVSIDLPSGLEADSGNAASQALSASHTITFASPKRGFFVRQGLEKVGEVWVGNIGTSHQQMFDAEVDCETIDLETAKSLLPYRGIDAHKGDAGRALIIGGSFGMSGAVALASRAALASGAGLCIAAMPEKIIPSFASSILEATSHPLRCDESGKLLESAADQLPELWKGVQVVALGPGISRSEGAQNFVRRVVRECPVPLIIDADALHALPSIAEEVKSREADTILTPHPGEMGTLLGISAKEVNDSRYEVAQQCAQHYDAIVVLKGARSLVATPNGKTFVNLTGNPGMATGGSGDVLTGTIAGLLAQLKDSVMDDAEAATKLGVYLHGYAGDLAHAKKGNGLVAGDIAANLPRALVEIPTQKVEHINGRLRKLE